MAAFAPDAIEVARDRAITVDGAAKAILFAACGGFAVVAAGLTTAVDDSATTKLRANIQVLAVGAGGHAVAGFVSCANSFLFAARGRLAVRARRHALAVDRGALAVDRTSRQSLAIIASCRAKTLGIGRAVTGVQACGRALAVIANRDAKAILRRALAKFGTYFQ